MGLLYPFGIAVVGKYAFILYTISNYITVRVTSIVSNVIFGVICLNIFFFVAAFFLFNPCQLDDQLPQVRILDLIRPQVHEELLDLPCLPHDRNDVSGKKILVEQSMKEAQAAGTTLALPLFGIKKVHKAFVFRFISSERAGVVIIIKYPYGEFLIFFNQLPLAVFSPQAFLICLSADLPLMPIMHQRMEKRPI